MKRGSLVGPLLLIAIGSLFLARNIFPDLPLLDFVDRYWPYLLIVWGGARLLEIGIWASAGKPLPVHGVSGGEWALVVLLCMIGLTINAARGITSWLPRANIAMGGLDIFGETFDYPVAVETAAPKNARVVLSGFRGDARIIGSDVDSVKVSGRQSIRSLDKEAADKAHASAPVEVSADGKQIFIRANQDRATGPLTINATLEIAVPRGASLELHGRRGDFDVSNINGTVDIDGENSSVRLENIAGSARLDVRSSDVIRATNLKSSIEIKGRANDLDLQNIEGSVNLNGTFGGVSQFRNVGKSFHMQGPNSDLSFESIPGTLRLTTGDVTATNVVGPIRFSSTRSKDLELTDFSNSLEVDLSGGDIRLRPLNTTAKIDARTKRGDIELSLGASSKFDLRATTEKGEVTNDFGNPISENQAGRGYVLHGSNGGPAMMLETKQGSIRVRRRLAPDTTSKIPEPAKPLRPLNQ